MEYQSITRRSAPNKSILGFIFLFVSLAIIQSAAADSIESAEGLAFRSFSSVASIPVAETTASSAQVKHTSSSIVPIPIQKSSSVYRNDKEQNTTTDQTIDVGRILSFTNTDPSPDFKVSSQSDPVPITLFGDNPSVVASSGSNGNNDWGRYQMDSVPANKKGSSSPLANGLIVSVRIAL